MSDGAVILCEGDLIRRERRRLMQIEAGLTRLGVQVLCAAPVGERAPLDEGWVEFEVGTRRFTRRDRVRRFVDVLPEYFEGACRPRIVHCFGERVWDVGFELARQLDVAMMIDVHAGPGIKRLKSTLPGWVRSIPVGVLVPDQAVRRVASRVTQPGSVLVAPWGVEASEGAVEWSGGEDATGIMLIMSGQDVDATMGFIDAFASVTSQHDGLLLFADGSLKASSEVWRRARQIGISDRLSVVPNLEGRRQHGLMTGVVVQTESVGHHHSYTIDAMANGCFVIAAADPLVEIINDNTCLVIEKNDEASWAKALRLLIDDPQRCHAIGDAARKHVTEHRPLDAYIEHLHAAYETICQCPVGGRESA